MSFGSEVNWQVFGEGEQGIERQKLKIVKGSEYIMDGTNVGAGYLMGLGKLLTSESDFNQILQKLQED